MSFRKVGKGDRISEYVLVGKLGEGGFGEVWKAEHVQIPGKYVAVKIPTSPRSVEFLKQEALFQHHLDHPNIVKTIGLDTRHDPPYFTMEYVEGRNLRQLMVQDGILPPPYAIDIAVQVCDALTFAHSRGIVHKDIKPENILVEKKRVGVAKKGKALLHYVKITDLGMGNFSNCGQSDIFLSDHARTSGVRILSGTLFYMGPEQMAPGRHVDARADIYSLGVVLYEMLTGELPLGMDLPSELNPVVTQELDAITKKCLSVDRDMRYRTAQDLAADLLKAKEAFLLKLVAAGTPALEVGPRGEIRRLTPRPAEVEAARAGWRPKRLGSTVLLALVVALLGVSAHAFLGLYRNSRVRERDEVPRRDAQGPVGPLILDTRPDGADVLLDHKRVGKTRLELKELPFERHALTLTLEHHESRELILEPGRSNGRECFRVVDRASQRELALRPCGGGFALEGVILSRRKGGVRITTPGVSAARVYIDGDFIGVTDDPSCTLALQGLDAGVRHFQIRKEGYKDFSFCEAIAGGATIEKEIALLALGEARPAARKLVKVILNSKPQDAAVYLDGEEKGLTPCVLEIPPGDYELRLVKKYYEPRMAILTSGTRDAHYELTRIRTRVGFDSETPGATVYLDGVRLGPTPVSADAIEGGFHTALFTMEGYYDQERTFEVVDGEPVGPIKAMLLKIPPARIAVECALQGVEAFLGGKLMGRTPVPSHRAEGGTCRVRILGVEKTVALEPGVEKTATFSLADLGLVRVEAGDFRFGADSPSHAEFPIRTERTGSYLIDRCEVSNAQYLLFYRYISETRDHSRCHPKEGSTDHKPIYWGEERWKHLCLPNHPVVGVKWYDAYAYAAWAEKRLPTEREWEKAARANTGWTYPWGAAWDPDEKRCNWGEKGRLDGHEFTSPVDAFADGASPLGCLNMVGNVSEWCSDDFSARRTEYKVVRGGSYLTKEWNTATMREYEIPNTTSSTLGFRCVVDPR